MKFIPFLVTVFLLLLISTVSCKKNLTDNADFLEEVPDLATKVEASVSGFVTDENDAPVSGATVKAGSIVTNTDNYGYFEAKNAMLVKDVAVVTIEQAGYFKAIKTFSISDGKATFLRIKLLPKFIAGIIHSGTGGEVSLPGGLSMSLPAGAVQMASGVAYTGSVQVAMQWIDPTSAELHKIMPGDLRGINDEGNIRGLITYGMAAIELIGASGELLQLADGKKATISMPIPASLSNAAPASIPLWFFDEVKGLWIEEGEASKSGNNFVGEVSHFSFWNYDVPENFVQFNCTLHDEQNNPLSFVRVKISVLSNPTNSAATNTNAAGFACGYVPANAGLRLEVFASPACSSPIYSENFNTGNSAYSAGIIVIPNTAMIAEVRGTVTSCDSSSTSGSYVVSYMNGAYTRYDVNNDGNYAFVSLLCGVPTPVRLIAANPAGSVVSSRLDTTLMGGLNVMSPLQTCPSQINMYDGKYLMSGYHTRDPYTFPYVNEPMEMVTVAPGEVAFYWPVQSAFGHPIGVGPGELNWYGNTVAPVVVFDTLTNIVSNVYNSAVSPPMGLYTGPGAGISHFDPVTRTIYVNWQYNGNPLRGFLDTLVYTGPR